MTASHTLTWQDLTDPSVDALVQGGGLRNVARRGRLPRLPRQHHARTAALPYSHLRTMRKALWHMSNDTPMSIDKRIKRTHEALNDARQRSADLMPDEQAALRVLYMAWERLKDFGWNDPIYCPKDGTTFDVIELGSVGVFTGRYVGEWPKGHWETMDDCDVYPSSRQPAMFRLQKVRVKAGSVASHDREAT